MPDNNSDITLPRAWFEGLVRKKEALAGALEAEDSGLDMTTRLNIIETIGYISSIEYLLSAHQFKGRTIHNCPQEPCTHTVDSLYVNERSGV